MARLNQERQNELEPKRLCFAAQQIEKFGYEVTQLSAKKIFFKNEGEIVTFFPYSGWATGKTIKDGRGLKNLLSQLTDHTA